MQNSRAARLVQGVRGGREGVPNFFVRNSIQPWRDLFGSFSSLLRTMKTSTHKGWSDWIPGHLRRGNKTSAARSRTGAERKHNVELEPPPNRIREALALQTAHFEEQADEEYKRREGEKEIQDAEDVEGPDFTYEEPDVP